MTASPIPPTRVEEMSDLELLRWVRRTLHRWPELGHEEHRTSAFLEGVLGGLGLRFARPAPTSLAVVIGPTSRPATAFRADLDAIATTEETGLPFASARPGIMHACGHDGHTAALVLLARRLARRPPASPALLIFQQAEEVHPSGAGKVLEGLSSDLWPSGEVYGVHLWPELPEGTVGVKNGALMPGISGINITFRATTGRSHGTHVDAGASDALNAVTQLCQAVRLSVPAGRRPTDQQPAVVHVGIAHAGEAPNQPANTGSVRATMRWLDRFARDRCEADLRRIADDVAAESAVDITVAVEHDVRPLVQNAEAAVGRVAWACEQTGVEVAAEYPNEPLGVSDDFGCYLDQAPGVLFLVGCRSNVDQADLHEPRFDFREEALLPLVEVLELLAHLPSGKAASA